MRFPARFADDVANLLPDRRLGNEIDVRIRVGLPALAFQDPARLTATGVVSGARNRIAKRNAFAVLAVFLERTMGEALLVAQLYAREVQYAVLHGRRHPLSAPRHCALIESCDYPERQMQAGAAVANLRAGHQRKSVAEARGRCRSAGALRDVLIHLAIFVWAGPKTFDRRYDHLRVDSVYLFPGKTYSIEHAGTKILLQLVAFLDHLSQDFLALGIFGVERDRTLVVVEHGEVQAVDVGYVLQLTARDVANP